MAHKARKNEEMTFEQSQNTVSMAKKSEPYQQPKSKRNKKKHKNKNKSKGKYNQKKKKGQNMNKARSPTKPPKEYVNYPFLNNSETQDVGHSVLTLGECEMTLALLKSAKENKTITNASKNKDIQIRLLTEKVNKLEQESKEDKESLRRAQNRNNQCHQETQKWINAYQQVKTELKESQRQCNAADLQLNQMKSQLQQEIYILQSDSSEHINKLQNDIIILQNNIKGKAKQLMEMKKEKTYHNRSIAIYTGKSKKYHLLDLKQLYVVKDQLDEGMEKVIKTIYNKERQRQRQRQNNWECRLCEQVTNNSVVLGGCSHIYMCSECEKQRYHKSCAMCGTAYKSVTVVDRKKSNDMI